jgi:Flp pilus assembly protein CpaB
MIEDYQAKRRRTRRLSRLLLLLGFVLAALSAGATYLYATTNVGRPVLPGTVQTVGVVVAARDIPPRTTLTAGDLKVVQTAPELAPANALRVPESAVGRLTTVPIANGEIMLPSKFQAAEGYSFSVFPAGQQPSGSAPEFRAMSISVPDTSAVAGAVQVGDLVDILFVVSFETRPVGAPTTASAPTTTPSVEFAARIIYDRIPILARSASTYTIRVDTVQAERISALLGMGANPQILLRAQDDTRAVRTSGALASSEVNTLFRSILR